MHVAADFRQEENIMSRTAEPGASECCICGKPYLGYGHNADPIKYGRCCNRCNDLRVIPARIRKMRKEAKAQSAPDEQAGHA